MFGSLLAFTTPWLLVALLALPVLWWLLRVTPPAPKTVSFPAMTFLLGLETSEISPAKTPWWLLLLRLLAAALLIIALAGPVIFPDQSQANREAKPLLLVVDNGWSAASRWPSRQKRLRYFITRAKRQGKAVTLLLTAPPPSQAQENWLRGPDLADNALEWIEALEPVAWHSDYSQTLQALQARPDLRGSDVIWLQDGLHHPEAEALADQLRSFGPVTLMRDDLNAQPWRILPPRSDGRKLIVPVERLNAETAQNALFAASASDGRLVTQEPLSFAPNQRQMEVTLDLPTTLRNRLFRLSLEGEQSAGAVQILDERWQRRAVGILSVQDSQTKDLLQPSTYMHQALAGFSDVQSGDLTTLLDRTRSVIFWPDSTRLNDFDRRMLEDWVKQGGLLVRFAGPLLAQATNDGLEQQGPLLPVRLRPGDRQIGGAMDWQTPLVLESFASGTPLETITLDGTVIVQRQVLAEPSPDLPDKVWARLEDGTPLITTTPLELGRVVLVHTAIDLTWSNLLISGTFVDLLRQLVVASKGQTNTQQTEVRLPPWKVMDGYGDLRNPGSFVMPIMGRDLINQQVSPDHPPGLYGIENEMSALTLHHGTTDQGFTSLPIAEPAWHQNMRFELYEAPLEQPLKPWLLLVVIALLVLDFLIRWRMTRQFAGSYQRSIVTSIFSFVILSGLLGILAPPAAIAQKSDQDIILNTRLAYVRTGEPRVDATSRAGLSALSRWIANRSSIDLTEPMGVDLEQDIILFYPVIYWPVFSDQAPLSASVIAKLNAYMAQGGMLLLDSQDAGLGTTGGSNYNLIRSLNGLTIPTLEPVPKDHVLTKSFYLIDRFPGRWEGGEVWVAAASEQSFGRVNDGVSPVILGGNHWAAAWALDDNDTPLFPVVPGLNRQRIFAFRFGMNLVMYALAGNYKADQVHVRDILERLNRRSAPEIPMMPNFFPPREE